MSNGDDLFQISASAFLNLALHVFRYWSPKPTGEKQVVYGLLIGEIEGDTRYVKKVAPLLHCDKPDLEMDEDFIKKQVGRINRREQNQESPYMVIGWYRSSNQGIKFIARDIKNLIPFQEFDSQFVALVFDPQKYLEEKSGFSVFKLLSDITGRFNMMSDYTRIPWEIEAIENAHEVITDFQKYIRNYFLNKPLITELND